MNNYLIFVNLLGFVICIYDKLLAKKKKFRISEKILLLVCLLGGVLGFYISSRIIRHKTCDKKFLIFMYPILILWIVILIIYFI